MLLGENHQAKIYLQTAQWMAGGNGRLGANIYISLGDLAVAERNCRDAIDHYEAAITLLDRTTSYGIGRMGTSQYGWYIFYKPSIALDLLPGFENIIYTDETIESLFNLGQCYENLSQLDLAEAIYEKILVLQPDNNLAALKLAEIKGE